MPLDYGFTHTIIGMGSSWVRFCKFQIKASLQHIDFAVTFVLTR